MFTIRYYFTDGFVYQISPRDVSSWKLAISRAKSYFQVVRQLANCPCSSVWIDHRHRTSDRIDETRIYNYEEA